MVFTTDEIKEMKMSDFKLIRIIGEGAFGVIWIAKHLQKKKHYALKIMEFKHAPLDVLDASNLALKIDHPNLMKFYGYFYEKVNIPESFYETNIIMVMEYIKGENLYDKIRNNHNIYIHDFLPQILDGLEYLHKNKIVHRDIKPENIIIYRKKIKIIDYDFLVYNNKINGKFGTPYYAAPEIYTKKYYDHRVDIWSLGILIWCCLEGREPFLAENRTKLKKKVMKEEPDWSQVEEEKLYPVLKGCLKKDPNKRLSIKQIKELIS